MSFCFYLNMFALLAGGGLSFVFGYKIRRLWIGLLLTAIVVTAVVFVGLRAQC